MGAHTGPHTRIYSVNKVAWLDVHKSDKETAAATSNADAVGLTALHADTRRGEFSRLLRPTRRTDEGRWTIGGGQAKRTWLNMEEKGATANPSKWDLRDHIPKALHSSLQMDSTKWSCSQGIGEWRVGIRERRVIHPQDPQEGGWWISTDQIHPHFPRYHFPCCFCNASNLFKTTGV